MGINEKLLEIQTELKAPKSQYNSFGKYKYRNCEDILEALKPLLAKVKAAVVITDEIVNIAQRFYVKATVRLINVENEEVIETSAYAREPENKKGLDESQITGSTSSYARKYALNAMFAIDDTKDSDYAPDSNSKPASAPKNKPLSNEKTNNVSRETLLKISNETLLKINKSIDKYANLTNKTPEEVRAVMGDRFHFTSIENISEIVGKTIYKQLNNWIVSRETILEN